MWIRSQPANETTSNFTIRSSSHQTHDLIIILDHRRRAPLDHIPDRGAPARESPAFPRTSPARIFPQRIFIDRNCDDADSFFPVEMVSGARVG